MSLVICVHTQIPTISLCTWPEKKKNVCFLFQEISAVGKELGIIPQIIRGEELKDKGFGGKFTFNCTELG